MGVPFFLFLFKYEPVNVMPWVLFTRRVHWGCAYLVGDKMVLLVVS